MSTTIEDRFILFLREDDEPHGYWQQLEEKTGISAQRWRKAYTRRQRPTPDMIEALCKQKPEYAFWMATGITDAENGHRAPSTAFTFPETPREYPISANSYEYFVESIKLNEYLYYVANVNTEDDEERLRASERIRVGSEWQSSELVKFAYELAASDEYKELQSIRTYREEWREHRKREQGNRDTGKETSTIRNMPSGKISLRTHEDPRTSHQAIRDLFWKPKNLTNENDDKKG